MSSNSDNSLSDTDGNGNSTTVSLMSKLILQIK